MNQTDLLPSMDIEFSRIITVDCRGITAPLQTSLKFYSTIQISAAFSDSNEEHFPLFQIHAEFGLVWFFNLLSCVSQTSHFYYKDERSLDAKTLHEMIKVQSSTPSSGLRPLPSSVWISK